MTHSIANMEYHLFKYDRFRHPGDVHYHFLGASVLSYSDHISIKAGDVFEISSSEFGKPLVNPVEAGYDRLFTVHENSPAALHA